MEPDATEQARGDCNYHVCTSDRMGRYVAASRKLKAGEVVMSEFPLAVGPACDAPLLCFGCHAPLAGKFSCCAACSRAPVCVGLTCQQSGARSWHDEAECSLFAASPQLTAATLVSRAGALLPLRCLLKRSSEPLSWQRLINMEHHLEERRGSDIWKFHEGTVEFIKSLGLGETDDDKDLIQKVCGIVDVNSFELRGALSPAGGVSQPHPMLRGVYPSAALMAHHCVGNTHIAVGADQALTVRAARDIAKGEIIYYNYVDALEDTTKRQERLRVGKYFTCECDRCLDPTEFSTHVGSVACPACRDGLLIPSKPITVGNGFSDNKNDTTLYEYQVIDNNEATENASNDENTDAERTTSYREEKLVKLESVGSEDTSSKTTSANEIVEDNYYNANDTADDTFWSCQDCEQKFPREAIECKVKACSRKFECIDKSSEEELSEYVEKVSVILSRRHYLVLAAQQALAGALRERIQREARPPARLLRQYTQLCSELLHVLQLLRPGVCRETAITLYELQAASVMLARKLFEAREMTAEAYMTELACGQELLKRSTAMLVLEPSGSPEGALCARALQELRDLRAAMLAIADAAATDSQTQSAAHQ